MSHSTPSSNPSTPPRWGILGTGGIARAFTADLKLTGHRVVAVGSRASGTADAFARQFGIDNAHGSYEALVADPEVDVIYVATPHTRHREDTALALRAGKHVLVEKPFTINAGEARELVQIAEALGLVLLEAMWTRWLPHMVEIRGLIARGELGEVRSLIADHTQRLPEDPAHRINALALGGGALLDLGVYPISFASELLGTPSEIEAHATFKPTGADAETGILLSHDGGRIASIYTASNALGPNRACVVGSEGRIEIDAVWYTPTSFCHYDQRGELRSTFSSDVPGRGMQFQADEIERLILGGQTGSAILPLAESVSIMETMDRIRARIGLRYPSE